MSRRVTAVFLSLIASLGIVSAAEPSPTAPPSLLAGQAFAVTMAAGGQSSESRFEFNDRGLAVTSAGADDGHGLTLTIESIKPRDGKLAFVAKGIDSGQTVVFEGTVAGDAISGTMTVSVPGIPVVEFMGKRAGPRVDATSDLQRGINLQLERKPKLAIPVFANVIESSRADLPQSVPALLHLIECHQLLKGDAAAAKDYADLVGKYLTTPPPLDGHSAPTIDQVKEDLLWKPWEAGKTSRIAFTVGNVSQQKSLVNGESQTQLQVQLTCDTTGLKLVESDNHFGGFDTPPVVKAADGQPSEGLVARDAAGKEYQVARLWKHSFHGLTVQLTFEHVPATVREFASITGFISVSQAKDTRLHEIALRPGTTWTTKAQKGRIKSCEETAKGWEVVYVLETIADETGNAGGVFSSAVSGSAGGGLMGEGCIVRSASGQRLRPHGMGSSGDGTTTTVTLNFPKGEQPDVLVLTEIASVSTRLIPVTVTKVALP